MQLVFRPTTVQTPLCEGSTETICATAAVGQKGFSWKSLPVCGVYWLDRMIGKPPDKQKN
jgi:hypothetical protein